MQEIKIDKNQNADNISDYLDEQTEKFNIQYAKKMLKNKKILAITVACLIAAIILFVLLFKLVSKLSAPENGIGNSANSGKVAYDGEYTYVALNDGLYKEKKNKITKISEDLASSIIVNKGNIYYMSASSQRYYDIKMINGDNGEIKTLNHIYTNVNKIFYYDNSLYYVSSDDGYGVRKLSLDDMNESLIILANIIDFSVEKNILYYTDITGNLIKINLKDKKQTVVDDEHGIRKIQVKKKWIYFYSNIEKGLCKVKNNGKGFAVLNENIKNDYFNITDKGNIYYLDQAEQGIFKGKIKAKKPKKIASLKNTTSSINLVNGIIYYEDYKDEESTELSLIRIKASGRLVKDYTVQESSIESKEGENQNTVEEDSSLNSNDNNTNDTSASENVEVDYTSTNTDENNTNTSANNDVNTNENTNKNTTVSDDNGGNKESEDKNSEEDLKNRVVFETEEVDGTKEAEETTNN